MAASVVDEEQLRLEARKLRKKLRQIEGLEILGRPLTPDEKAKVERKIAIRAELHDVLLRLSQQCESRAVAGDSAAPLSAAAVPLGGSAAAEAVCKLHDADSSRHEWQESATGNREHGPQPKKSRGGCKSSDDLRHTDPSSPDSDFRHHDLTKREQLDKSEHVVTSLLSTASGERSKATGLSQHEEAAAAARAYWSSACFSVEQLSGHADVVCSVSLRGKFLASGSRDTSVKLWDVESLAEILSFGGHTGAVTAVVLLDGVQAATLLGDECRRESTVDARAIISGSSDCSVKVWSCSTGAEVCSAYLYNPVTCVAYVENLDAVAVGMAGGKIELLSAADGLASLCSVTCTDQEDIVCLAVDGLRLCTGSAAGTLSFFDLGTRCSGSSGSGKETRASRSADSQEACGGAKEGERRQLALRQLREIACDGLLPRSIVISDDAVLVGSDRSSVRVYSWSSGKYSRVPNHVSEFGVTDGLSVCRQGAFLLATAYDYDSGTGCINVRALSAGCSYVGTIERTDLGRLLCMTALDGSDGETITAATGGYELLVWRIASRMHEASGSRRQMRVKGDDSDDGAAAGTAKHRSSLRGTFLYKRELASARADADSEVESSVEDGDSSAGDEDDAFMSPEESAAAAGAGSSWWRCAVI